MNLYIFVLKHKRCAFIQVCILGPKFILTHNDNFFKLQFEKNKILITGIQRLSRVPSRYKNSSTNIKWPMTPRSGLRGT